MGRTLDEWVQKVGHLVRDAAGRDSSYSLVEATGLRPAFAQFGLDRPYRLVVESAGEGSAYLELPDGWEAGFSALEAVEFPARQDPPSMLDSQSWRFVRSTADVAVTQILLDRSPAASQYVRLWFTARWPFPTEDDDDDQVGDGAFEAVAALAASFCLTSLAAQAAQSRAASMPTNYVDGSDRARVLMEAAKAYRGIYNSFLGIGGGDDGDSGGGAPAWGSFDLDPSHASLYHGGRR